MQTPVPDPVNMLGVSRVLFHLPLLRFLFRFLTPVINTSYLLLVTAYH